MYNPITTEDFDKWIKADSREFEVRCYVGKHLPDEYQACEYIRPDPSVSGASKYAWIDTGVLVTNKTSVSGVLKADGSKNGTIYGIYFGSNSNFYGWLSDTRTTFQINRNSKQVYGQYNKLYSFYGDTTQGIWNDGEPFSAPATILPNESTLPLFVEKSYQFQNLVNGSQGYIKLCSLVIKNGNTVVRDYQPCYRKSDGEIGLYDYISNTFFTDMGGGERGFLKGADIEITNTTLVGTGAGGDIISMEWNNVICSNDGLQIGTCCMDEFRMTYRNNPDLPSLMGMQIQPYVGLVCPHENTGDVTVWCPLGVFYVTNAETSDEEKTYTITAYDGMINLLGNFDADELCVEFPIASWRLLEAIASSFGTVLVYDKTVYNLVDSDGYYLKGGEGSYLVVQDEKNLNQYLEMSIPYEGTYRDYVGWIVGLAGANAHMGRNGELVVTQYTDYNYQIPRTIQHMGGAKINYGGSVTYSSMVSGTEETPIYPTSYSGNAITYTNPYMTQDAIDIACENLFEDGDITVTPCDVTWRSDPRIDVGDVVGVEDKDGNFSSVYVMERTMRITGGISEELHCYAETEMQKQLNKSPTTTMINSTPSYIKVLDDEGNVKTLTIKTVTINGITINYLGY